MVVLLSKVASGLEGMKAFVLLLSLDQVVCFLYRDLFILIDHSP